MLVHVGLRVHLGVRVRACVRARDHARAHRRARWCAHSNPAPARFSPFPPRPHKSPRRCVWSARSSRRWPVLAWRVWCGWVWRGGSHVAALMCTAYQLTGLPTHLDHDPVGKAGRVSVPGFGGRGQAYLVGVVVQAYLLPWQGWHVAAHLFISTMTGLAKKIPSSSCDPPRNGTAVKTAVVSSTCAPVERLSAPLDPIRPMILSIRPTLWSAAPPPPVEPEQISAPLDPRSSSCPTRCCSGGMQNREGGRGGGQPS